MHSVTRHVLSRIASCRSKPSNPSRQLSSLSSAPRCDKKFVLSCFVKPERLSLTHQRLYRCGSPALFSTAENNSDRASSVNAHKGSESADSEVPSDFEDLFEYTLLKPDPSKMLERNKERDQKPKKAFGTEAEQLALMMELIGKQKAEFRGIEASIMEAAQKRDYEAIATAWEIVRNRRAPLRTQVLTYVFLAYAQLGKTADLEHLMVCMKLDEIKPELSALLILTSHYINVEDWQRAMYVFYDVMEDANEYYLLAQEAYEEATDKNAAGIHPPPDYQFWLKCGFSSKEELSSILIKHFVKLIVGAGDNRPRSRQRAHDTMLKYWQSLDASKIIPFPNVDDLIQERIQNLQARKTKAEATKAKETTDTKETTNSTQTSDTKETAEPKA